MKLLQKYLDKLDFTSEIITIPLKYTNKLPNRYHLIARKFLSKQLPTLLIYNHIDVVPGDYKDAFRFKNANGKYYGRGTSDHKGGTIAVIDALSSIKSEKLKYNIVFWATTDEETSQFAQLKYMSKKLDLPKNTLVFDTDTFAGGITIARMGLYTLKITIRGKSTHSAMSNLGKNPLEDATKLMEELIKIKHEYERQESAFHAFPSSGLKKVVNRCNMVEIHSGIAANVIPDAAVITVNCRFIPEQDVNTAVKKLKKRIVEFCTRQNIKVGIEDVSLMQGYGNDNEFAKKLQKIYHQFEPNAGRYCILGSCDLSQWAYENKLISCGLGVARGDTNVHGVDEFVYEEDIEQLSRTLQQFLIK